MSEENLLKQYRVYPKRKTGTTQIAKFADAANASVVIHTVSAGKTLYLFAASLGGYAYAAGFYETSVLNGSQEYQYNLLMGFAGASQIIPVSISFVPPLEIPSGWIVRVFSGAAGLSVRGNIFGWEE